MSSDPQTREQQAVTILVNQLGGCVRCARHLRLEAWFLPSPGSPAAEHLKIADMYAASVEESYVTAHLQMAAADDHLLALETLIQGREHVFALFPIARAALEACARAWLLMDPETTPRTRVARWLNERLYGLWEAGQFPMDEIHDDVAQKIAVLKGEAKGFGFEVTAHTRRRAPQIADERRPSMTDSIRALFESRTGAPLGETMSRQMSGVAHGVPASLASLMQPMEDPRAEHQLIAIPRLSLETLVPLAVTTIIAYVQATGRQIAFFGWNEPLWMSWQSYSLRQCQTLVNAL